MIPLILTGAIGVWFSILTVHWHRERNEWRETKASWEQLRSVAEQASAREGDLEVVRRASAELDGSWRNAFAFGAHLQELLALAPDILRILKIDIETQFDVAPTGVALTSQASAPFRSASVLLAGKAEGTLADRQVNGFLQQIRSDLSWRSSIERVHLEGLQELPPRPDSGAGGATIFAIRIHLTQQPMAWRL